MSRLAWGAGWLVDGQQYWMPAVRMDVALCTLRNACITVKSLIMVLKAQDDQQTLNAQEARTPTASCRECACLPKHSTYSAGASPCAGTC